jgi:hypothetical protein
MIMVSTNEMPTARPRQLSGGHPADQELIMISLSNNNLKSVFSTSFQGNRVRVLEINARAGRTSVTGKMVVSIELFELAEQEIDNEVAIERSVRQLIKVANNDSDTADVFKAEDLRLKGTEFVHLGGKEYIAIVAYSGEIPNDEEPVPSNPVAYLNYFGIPYRSASY